MILTPFDSLMVDELRAEFRRTHPPRRAITAGMVAGIFQVTEAGKVGFRVLWYDDRSLPANGFFWLDKAFFQLIETLS